MPVQLSSYTISIYHLCEFTVYLAEPIMEISTPPPLKTRLPKMTATYTTDDNTLLGNLLVKAELVSTDMLEIALQISAGFGESLGQVLLDTHRISEGDLQNALSAQLMVKNGMDEQVAAKALNFSNKTRSAFGDSIARFPLQLAQAA